MNRAILQHCFSWFFNTGENEGIFIFLPNFTRFICNGAVDWTQGVSAVQAFYKKGNSFVIAHGEFRREFLIHRNRAVPPAHAIKNWVRNFEATDSTLKKKGI